MSIRRRLEKIKAAIPKPRPDLSGFTDAELREVVMMGTRRAWIGARGDRGRSDDPVAEAIRELHPESLQAVIGGPAGMKRVSNTLLEDKANDIKGLQDKQLPPVADGDSDGDHGAQGVNGIDG